MNYMEDSAAPRDFRISSISYESEGKCMKCMLCRGLKRVFYCSDCINRGEFVHSTIINNEKFCGKQERLTQTKQCNKILKERCENLLAGKSRADSLILKNKQCKDKIIIIKLAIEQRKNNIEKHKQRLLMLMHKNTELKTVIPNYKKHVSSIMNAVNSQRGKIQKKVLFKNEQENMLANLRRLKVRELVKYILPVQVTMATIDSYEVDDNELLKEIRNEIEQYEKIQHLIILTSAIPAHFTSEYIEKVLKNKKLALESGATIVDSQNNSIFNLNAGLLFTTQLTIVLSKILDVRLPYSLSINESNIVSAARVKRLYACVVWLCAHSTSGLITKSNKADLSLLYKLTKMADCPESHIGRVENWLKWDVIEFICDEEDGKALNDSDEEPPEHLQWNENDCEEMTASMSYNNPDVLLRVSNATASVVSFFKGWTTHK